MASTTIESLASIISVLFYYNRIFILSKIANQTFFFLEKQIKNYK